MKELICIGCPRGCRLSIDENNDFAVTGNNCEIGARFGKEELTNPQRVLTTTMKCDNGQLIPVRTDKTIKKALLIDAMEVINNITVKTPVKMHQVLVENILDSGANIVACKEIN